ncbi:MAG TPA: tetratricopeptide repeat protein, partial [Anaerolineae bacterium]|nr:tetratricopeptide repeat protein [Anaerolineae bacterium]
MTNEPMLPPGVNPATLHALATLLRHAEAGAFVAALYNTAAVRDAVVDVLRARLAPLPVYDFTFTEQSTNPLDYRARLPKDALGNRAVIFLYDLYRAGETMYGYLEIQREALAHYPHGLVFWLTPGEREMMVRRAPNFWSQRSGTFDFTVQDTTALSQIRGEMAGGGYRYVDLGDWERKLRLYRGLVDEYEALENPPTDTLLDLYEKVGGLYYAVSQYRNALDWSYKLLELAKSAGEKRFQAIALNNIGRVYSALGDNQRALEYLEAALAILREVGDRAGEGTTLNNIAGVYSALGDKQRALAQYEAALAIRREVGDRAGEGATLNNIAGVYAALGDNRRALAQYEAALAILREVGDRAGEGTTLNNIGLVYRTLGDNQRALEYYEAALAIRREVGDRAGEGTTLNNIAAVYSALGDKQRALAQYEAALAIRREVGDRAGEG